MTSFKVKKGPVRKTLIYNDSKDVDRDKIIIVRREWTKFGECCLAQAYMFRTKKAGVVRNIGSSEK